MEIKIRIEMARSTKLLLCIRALNLETRRRIVEYCVLPPLLYSFDNRIKAVNKMEIFDMYFFSI